MYASVFSNFLAHSLIIMRLLSTDLILNKCDYELTKHFVFVCHCQILGSVFTFHFVSFIPLKRFLVNFPLSQLWYIFSSFWLVLLLNCMLQVVQILKNRKLCFRHLFNTGLITSTHIVDKRSISNSNKSYFTLGHNVSQQLSQVVLLTKY